jgi:hypothetical protein
MMIYAVCEEGMAVPFLGKIAVPFETALRRLGGGIRSEGKGK